MTINELVQKQAGAVNAAQRLQELACIIYSDPIAFSRISLALSPYADGHDKCHAIFDGAASVIQEYQSMLENIMDTMRLPCPPGPAATETGNKMEVATC